jgi:TolA-binding protein
MTTCERYAELDSAERYVAGRMTTDQAVEFERHFLACDACLATVKGIEDVRDALAARRAALLRGEVDPLGAAPTRPGWTWAAAAGLAAAAALVAGVFWMRGGAPSPSSSPGSTAPAVARDAQPGPSSAPSAPPSSGTPGSSGASGAPGANRTAPATASSSKPPSESQSPSGAPAPPPGTPTTLIGRLAIVVPPPYVAVPVRGEGDDVQQAFSAAMTRYRAGDYAGAAKGLRALVEKSPELTAAQFYLGISELMTRQTRRAETALRAAADSEITPYADEAYFYLAKAALQREDLSAAERALTEAVAREAGPGNEARVLLEEVRALGRS